MTEKRKNPSLLDLFSAFINATSDDDLAKINKILKHPHFDINFQDSLGDSLLHHCTSFGKYDIAKRLLSRGAKVNICNLKGETPIIIACCNENLDICSLLIKYNANVNHADNGGLTALHWAVMRGSTQVVKFLISNKANINCRDKGENTPLHIAALCEYLEVTKVLLKNYAEVNVRTLNGTTPLHHACEKANFAITHILLKKKISINAQDESGFTGLHLAVRSGNISLVKLLLDYGADQTITTREGKLPSAFAESVEMKRFFSSSTPKKPNSTPYEDWIYIPQDGEDNGVIRSIWHFLKGGESEERKSSEDLNKIIDLPVLSSESSTNLTQPPYFHASSDPLTPVPVKTPKTVSAYRSAFENDEELKEKSLIIDTKNLNDKSVFEPLKCNQFQLHNFEELNSSPNPHINNISPHSSIELNTQDILNMDPNRVTSVRRSHNDVDLLSDILDTPKFNNNNDNLDDFFNNTKPEHPVNNTRRNSIDCSFHDNSFSDLLSCAPEINGGTSGKQIPNATSNSMSIHSVPLMKSLTPPSIPISTSKTSFTPNFVPVQTKSSIPSLNSGTTSHPTNIPSNSSLPSLNSNYPSTVFTVNSSVNYPKPPHPLNNNNNNHDHKNSYHLHSCNDNNGMHFNSFSTLEDTKNRSPQYNETRVSRSTPIDISQKSGDFLSTFSPPKESFFSPPKDKFISAFSPPKESNFTFSPPKSVTAFSPPKENPFISTFSPPKESFLMPVLSPRSPQHIDNFHELENSSNAKVVEFFTKLGLSKYLKEFIDEEWDWDSLLEITNEDLQDMGIKAGSRRKILNAIQRYKTINPQECTNIVDLGPSPARNNISREFWDIDFNALTLTNFLGNGFYGSVYRGVWNNVDVAIKKLTKLDNFDFDKWMLEVRLLLELRHPNIVTCYCACTQSPNYCIVLEYLPRGSLYKVLKDKTIPIDHKKRLSFAIDCAKGMIYLHDRNPPIIHRDLKSDNLLVTEDWHVKVSDFGLSRAKDETYSYTHPTSPFDVTITSPEVLMHNHMSEKADVYSYGLLMWELYSRSRPFEGMNPHWVAQSVIHEELRPVIGEGWTAAYVTLMKECWSQDYRFRPTFKEILLKLEMQYKIEVSPETVVVLPSEGYV